MDALRIALTVLFVIDCVFLTIVVLMQEGKNDGLGSLAGNSDTYWGKNKSRSKEGNLVKATKAMAALFVVLALVLNLNF